MLEQFSHLEKLYAWRNVLLHSRILPVWVLLALMLAAWWLLGLGFDWAFDWVWLFAVLSLLAFVWLVWPGYSILRKRALQKAQQLVKSNDSSSAYQIYQRLNRLAVFPWEKTPAQLDLAWFLFNAGNSKRAYKLASDLAVHVKDLSEVYRVSLTFLQTMQLEDAQAYDQALARWNELLESVETTRAKIQIYNNRGRIYDKLHQLDFAQTEYEKAYELFKRKPKAELLPIILRNLLLNYAKQGLFEKAENLISEYQALLGKNKHGQWLEFSNDLLHAGRESNHKAWIDRAYAIQQELEPQNEDDAFVFSLSELRMRLNDGLDFERTYQQFMPKVKAQLAQERFDLNQMLYIHKELVHVLGAKLKETQGAEPWLSDLKWLTEQSKHWLCLVDEALAKVDTALPKEKINWLKAKQRVLKDSLEFESDIKLIEQTAKELAKIQIRVIGEWQAVNNVYQQVEEQIILVHDALNYTLLARTPEEYVVMDSIYRTITETTLNNLLNWEFNLKTYRGHENQIIFIAYALIQMHRNPALAKQLMDKLHTEPFSLKHYARFVREMYDAVNKVLAQM